jgi:hypothetical protein
MGERRPAPRRLGSLILAACTAASVTSCGTGPTPSPTPTTSLVAGHTPATSPAPGTPPPATGTPGTSDAPAPVTKADVAWGEIAIARLPVQVEPSRYFVYSGSATPDGRFLIGSLLRNSFLETPGIKPGSVVLYEVATGKVTTLASMRVPTSLVFSASADEDWIVWQEAADSAGYDWRLFAADRATLHVHEVARAAVSGGRSVPSPLSFVSVSRGIVVWGQAIGTGVEEGSVANAVVLRADLATGTTTTVATAAGSPAFSWPWLAWSVFPADAPRELRFANLETGWTGSSPTVPASIALSGSSAAYAAADLHSIWLVEDVTNATAAVEIARGVDDADYLQWPSINERILAWSQDDSSLVYDRADHRLVSLPVSTGWSSGMVSGALLVWFEADPVKPSADHPDWVVVADTGTFPVRN